MGYWKQIHAKDATYEGVWGDPPADILDDALLQIMAVFVKDIGRLPSRAEMLAGIEFSLGGPTASLLPLPENPADCPDVSSEDLQVIEENYWNKTRDGARKITETLGRLTQPYDPSTFTGAGEPT
jgi:hypothetical protein